MGNPYKNQEYLVKILRDEIKDVKECFNKYSYQSLVFCGALFAFIIKDMSSTSYLFLSSIPAILLLIIVKRIGIHKYSTANRNSGYELFLSRLENLNNKNKISNNEYTILKSQSWEEVLRAWRIVQPIIFESIYKTNENLEFKNCNKLFSPFKRLHPKLYSYRNEVKEYIKKNRGNMNTAYPWFDLKELSYSKKIKRSRYYVGSYLEKMFSVLDMMQFLLLTPFVFYLYRNIDSFNKINNSLNSFKCNIFNQSLLSDNIKITFTFLLLFIIILIMLFNQSRVKRRRKMLENELLSIHSCSITWNAVVLIHLLALKESTDYRHYTEELVKIAENLVLKTEDNICGTFNIHQWIEKNIKKIN